MSERPILFSGPMVRAIIEGRKTQTRRLLSERHAYHFLDGVGDLALCPYGEPGDRLWVRETWAPCDYVVDGVRREDPTCIAYAAGRAARRIEGDGSCDIDTRVFGWDNVTWRPSIHMPRWASRITLRVTSVRVERLQAITGADVVAEGVSVDRCPCEPCGMTSEMCPGTETDHIMAFAQLWDSINGKRASWASNPWVWVVGFEREVPA